MLILAYTDRFRVNLYQLRQRVLKTSGNGRSTSLPHIEIGEFLCSQLAGRVYGSSGLVGDDIVDILRNLFQHLHDHLLGLSRCRAVAQGDQRNIVFMDEFFHGFFCSSDLGRSCGRCWIDDYRIQHFSGRVYNCQFTAGTEGRVPSQNHLSHNGRLHEKLFQILLKYLDGPILRLLCHVIANLPLNGRTYQTAVAVLHHSL